MGDAGPGTELGTESGAEPGSEPGAAPPAPAVVHLPRSLVALFPGADRLMEARGTTVLDVITDLDRRVPGLDNRLLDAGPSIRTHLNIFVNGERATLDTVVPPGARVHVIPAVSGG